MIRLRARKSSKAREASTKLEGIYGCWQEFHKATGQEPLVHPGNEHRIHWQHGWHSSLANVDPDLVIGEGGEAYSHKDHVFFVGRTDQEVALKGFGFHGSKAIGLPFAYALKALPRPVERQKNSLLIMPSNHAIDEDGSYYWPEDDELIQHAMASSRHFQVTTVAMYSTDIDLGRSSRWNRAGFNIVRGAASTDQTSLSRIAHLLLSHEVMMTNATGSHISYAAAAGNRISIHGPKPTKNRVQMSKQFFYRNRPDLISAKLRILEGNISAAQDLGMVCPPEESQKFVDWGHAQIGSGNVLSRRQARLLFKSL